MKQEGHSVNSGDEKNLYADVEAGKSLQLVTEGQWLLVDGMEYSFGPVDDKAQYVETPFDDDGNPNRLETVGTYCHHHGKLAYVDARGQLWIGAHNDENVAILNTAGYSPRTFTVPFTNGQRPTNSEDYKLLRDVCTGENSSDLLEERTDRVEALLQQRRMLFAETANLPDKGELFDKVSDRREHEPVNVSELVQNKCNPWNEIDDTDGERTIYNIGDNTFGFKSREEMPLYSSATESKTTVLGEKPCHSEVSAYQSYAEDLHQSSEESQHFIASKTPLGVVELAIALGSEDTSLHQLREQLARGEYSERALALTDAIIACNYLDYDEFQDRVTCDGAALVVLALLGDTDAQNAVANSIEFLRQFEKEQKEHEQKELALVETNLDPLKPEELCIVHATSYEPEMHNDGSATIQTTFDATKGEIPRVSVHTTLNHKVESHMYGSWEGAGHIVISPFNDTVDSNGLPAVLNTVDTYWSCNPSEKFTFPNATVVTPGGNTGKELITDKGDVVEFKSENLDLGDFQKVREANAGTHGGNPFDNDIENMIFHYFYSPIADHEGVFDGERARELLHAYCETGAADSEGSMIAQKLIEKLQDGESTNTPSIEEALLTVFKEANLQECVKTEEKEEALSRTASMFAGQINSSLIGQISRFATNHAIQKKGYTVQPGGTWAWGGSWDVTEQTVALAKNLGVKTGAHTGHPDSEVTDRWTRAKFEATDGGKEETFDWKKFHLPLEDLLPELDPATRRMVYASGLLGAAKRTVTNSGEIHAANLPDDILGLDLYLD